MYLGVERTGGYYCASTIGYTETGAVAELDTLVAGKVDITGNVAIDVMTDDVSIGTIVAIDVVILYTSDAYDL